MWLCNSSKYLTGQQFIETGSNWLSVTAAEKALNIKKCLNSLYIVGWVIGEYLQDKICFLTLFGFRIEIGQLLAVNCYVINHCLSVSCKLIYLLCFALVIYF